MNRQNQWLKRAVHHLRPVFKRIGFPLPLHIAVARQKCTQEHWFGEHLMFEDGTREIHVTPRLKKGRQVLAILMHELSHAATSNADYNHDDHRPKFKRCDARIRKAVDIEALRKKLGRYL